MIFGRGKCNNDIVYQGHISNENRNIVMIWIYDRIKMHEYRKYWKTQSKHVLEIGINIKFHLNYFIYFIYHRKVVFFLSKSYSEDININSIIVKIC